MRHIIPFLFTTVITLFSFSACGKPRAEESKVAEIQNADSLPQSVKLLVKAVADGDTSAFASIVSYPLERPYPLRDIVDSTQMVGYYNIMVDDSLHHVLTTSAPEKWSELGWRGWTVKNGEYLWIDEKLYDVNYLSKEEIALRDRLIAEEIACLPEDMREGWTPVIILTAPSDGSVYRIDSHKGPGDSDIFRLAIYAANDSLTGRPSLTLTGHRMNEGTASTTTYHFSDEKGDSALYQADITDSEDPVLTFFLKGEQTDLPVKKVYWRDLRK